MTIDREPGGSTMIRVSLDIRDQLNALKEHPREAIGDVVKRIILDNRRLQRKEKQEMPTKILAPDQPCLMPVPPVEQKNADA